MWRDAKENWKDVRMKTREVEELNPREKQKERETSPGGQIDAFVVDSYKITTFLCDFGRISAVLFKC